MENLSDENQMSEKEKEEILIPKKDRDYLLPASIVIAALIISGSWLYGGKQNSGLSTDYSAPEEKVLPPEGVTLPVIWRDLGMQLVEDGVIDKEKFLALYGDRGGLQESDKSLLEQRNSGKIVITPFNANFLLNLFWALGLGNKNEILERGEMTDKRYGGKADNFASTGGWTLAVGKPMDHYSHHSMISLTSEQQSLVESVSKNIYRPCCGNSVHFPDCNHGMAMLGLLELMASQGVSEKDMYKFALQVNAYWFPDTYLTIAKYLEVQGSSWQKSDPKELLGANYSSGAGYQKILNQVAPPTQKGGGSCGV